MLVREPQLLRATDCMGDAPRRSVNSTLREEMSYERTTPGSADTFEFPIMQSSVFTMMLY